MNYHEDNRLHIAYLVDLPPEKEWNGYITLFHMQSINIERNMSAIIIRIVK